MNVFEYMQEGQWIAAISIMTFSFFAGWSIGFALKTILRILLLVAGVILLAIFALQYVEIIPSVNWDRVAELFQIGINKTKGEGTLFFKWLAQQLPIASAVIAGLYFGFNKR